MQETGDSISQQLSSAYNSEVQLNGRNVRRIPYPRERGSTMEYRPTPHFGLNLLLRSNVYSNMRPCVAALENAAQMAGYED